jgi:hypothetical protein
MKKDIFCVGLAKKRDFFSPKVTRISLFNHSHLSIATLLIALLVGGNTFGPRGKMLLPSSAPEKRKRGKMASDSKMVLLFVPYFDQKR